MGISEGRRGQAGVCNSVLSDPRVEIRESLRMEGGQIIITLTTVCQSRSARGLARGWQCGWKASKGEMKLSEEISELAGWKMLEGIERAKCEN